MLFGRQAGKLLQVGGQAACLLLELLLDAQLLMLLGFSRLLLIGRCHTMTKAHVKHLNPDSVITWGIVFDNALKAMNHMMP